MLEGVAVILALRSDKSYHLEPRTSEIIASARCAKSVRHFQTCLIFAVTRKSGM